MTFCTAINCMDGRVQIPIVQYMMKRFRANYVDMVTEAGPNFILARRDNENLVASIFRRVDISLERHGSAGIAIVGHHDCAGNPSPEDDQIAHLERAVQRIRQRYSDAEVIALWIDEKWKVRELRPD